MARRTVWLLIAWLVAMFLLSLDVLLDEALRALKVEGGLEAFVPLYAVLVVSLLACWGVAMATRHRLAVKILLLILAPVGIILQMVAIGLIGLITSGLAGTQ